MTQALVGITLRGLAVLAIVALATACDAVESGPAGQAQLTDFVAALDPDVPILERSDPAGSSETPPSVTRIWPDGRYEIDIGTPALFTASIEDALADAMVDGVVPQGPLNDFLRQLRGADRTAIEARIEAATCSTVLDGHDAPSSLTLGTPDGRWTLQFCTGWTPAAPVPLVDSAWALLDAARMDRADDLDAYLDGVQALDRVVQADWTEAALVIGELVEIDPNLPQLVFVVIDEVAGVPGAERYALPTSAFNTDVRPTEQALLEAARAGDRVVALVRGASVDALGFADTKGRFQQTEISRSVFNLGWAAALAVDLGYTQDLEPVCGSRYFRYRTRPRAENLDALIGAARVGEAPHLRNEFVKTSREAETVGTVAVTVRRKNPDDIVVFTQAKRTYLGHVGRSKRTSGSTEIRLLEDTDEITVWVFAPEDIEGCKRWELSALARATGSNVTSFSVDELPNDPGTPIEINVRTGRIDLAP